MILKCGLRSCVCVCECFYFHGFSLVKWQCLCEILFIQLSFKTQPKILRVPLELRKSALFTWILFNSHSSLASLSVLMQTMKWNEKMLLLCILCVDDWYLEMIGDMFPRHPQLSWLHLIFSRWSLSTFENRKKPENWRKFWLFLWISDQSEHVWHYVEDNFSIEYRYLYWMNSNWLTGWLTDDLYVR